MLDKCFYALDDRPEFVVEPEDTDINIRTGGESVTLECGSFAADTITWERRDGTVPHQSMILSQENYRSMLVIPNIRREDAGEYRCVADGRGSRNSRYAHIRVTGR